MNGDFANLPLWFVPACTAGVGIFIASIKMRAANRTADETVADGQYKRLLQWAEKMEHRVLTLEKELEVCHRERTGAIAERDAALADVARLEAVQLGMGIGRQRASEVVAADRAEQRDKKPREQDG